MKIIIPMAGRGTRLRPHTLTVPKPLVPVAGKPIVQRLVEDLVAGFEGDVEEIAFIIGDFGEQVEVELLALAERLGAKGSIYHQTEKLGTAHALMCAKESLSGNVIVAFADTLFKASFKLDTAQDGVIWVKEVDDPSAFGVVTLDNTGIIQEFVEKPTEFVSNRAIVGIYYFRDGENLRKELAYLIDNKIMDRGEYQLTDALENMKQQGLKFKTATIDEWLDCGNKNAVVYANQRVLEIKAAEKLVADNVQLENATIIPPCFIGENVVISNSVIGPHVSIGKDSKINASIINNSLIQEGSKVENLVMENSMIGNAVNLKIDKKELSLGDYSTYNL